MDKLNDNEFCLIIATPPSFRITWLIIAASLLLYGLGFYWLYRDINKLIAMQYLGIYWPPAPMWLKLIIPKWQSLPSFVHALAMYSLAFTVTGQDKRKSLWAILLITILLILLEIII